MNSKVGIAAYYINQKVFSRRIFASHKILSLLMGQFTIYKMCTLVQRYVFIQIILKAEVNVGMRNIEMVKMCR